MRAIHKVRLDKVRPAVILTRASALNMLNKVVVAPIGSKIYGIASEVPVGPQHGLDHASVIKVDNVTAVSVHDIGDFIGILTDEDEERLTEAIHAAFDLT